MAKSKANTSTEPKEIKTPELFEDDRILDDEIESDGSANAFDETERVNEDNFDNLSEK